ncbi:MAG: putative nicotinate-nucleotide pyrophosphorylase (carboxylating) [Syntrophaceae bacterium PtaB.Bin038]|nr:MAG: putative nicotinate-nucleotide pyrophosphorylase (carboxylating) [Syntrophaceae bacterium PtaB.Bin038]
MLEMEAVRTIIRRALEEDIRSGDVTTACALAGAEKGTAKALAKEDLVVAGLEVFREVFRLRDPALTFRTGLRDGDRVTRGTVLAGVQGQLAAILTAERVALNLLQRMCGIATLTRQFVEAVAGTKAGILDTRKTMPGLRVLDKYSVQVGGGRNHRYGLYDGVLIKDNHIEAAGGIGNAVRRVRDRAPLLARIEVEVKTLAEARQALDAGADVIMLDNMPVDAMRKAVALIGGKAIVEASGNVTLATVKAIAETGVDFISSGALTHSARAADISLKVKKAKGRG